MGTALHRPTVLPIPRFALRMIYGEVVAVLTESKEVYPKPLLDKGFKFKYGDIESAMKDLL